MGEADTREKSSTTTQTCAAAAGERQPVGEGGFFLPVVYEENSAAVTGYLKQGDILHVEESRLSLAVSPMSCSLYSTALAAQ